MRKIKVFVVVVVVVRRNAVKFSLTKIVLKQLWLSSESCYNKVRIFPFDSITNIDVFLLNIYI